MDGKYMRCNSCGYQFSEPSKRAHRCNSKLLGLPDLPDLSGFPGFPGFLDWWKKK
jgi:hypothetical protein